MSAQERRILTQPLELRKADAEPSRIVGYAAVFNREANIAGFFREKIAPGAFKTALKEDDVRALFNHDPNYVLGRTAAGTLTLTEDDTGLRYDAEPPDTQWAKDLLVSIERGDVNQSSFGFMVVREEWTKPEDRAELPLRTILEARLFDVSPVTYPAYEETTAEARVVAEALAKAEAVLDRAHEDAARGAMVLRQKRQAILEGTL
jgi:HK97 family phage prohead protease